MAAVRAGGDRQRVHEAIRVHSRAAVARMKEEGANDNDLLARLRGDAEFKAIAGQLDGLLDPKRFTGRAESQTREFLDNFVAAVLRAGAQSVGERVVV